MFCQLLQYFDDWPAGCLDVHRNMVYTETLQSAQIVSQRAPPRAYRRVNTLNGTIWIFRQIVKKPLHERFEHVVSGDPACYLVPHADQ